MVMPAEKPLATVKVNTLEPFEVQAVVPPMGADIVSPPAELAVMLGDVPAMVKAPVPVRAIVCSPERLAVVMLLNVTVTAFAIVAVPAVAVVPEKPKLALSALVNVYAAGVAVPAEDVDQKAELVFHAPVNVPKPAVAPLRSKYRTAIAHLPSLRRA